MAVSSSSSLLLMFLVFAFAAAAPKDYLIGGKPDAWKVPSSESDSLNKWAQSVRFRIADHLIFNYETGKDSVLQVSKEDYTSCNISNPIKKYNDGKTKVRFDHSGSYYYISGEKGHCEKGQKVIVSVISPRSPSVGPVSPASAPSPGGGVEGPAVAPSPTSGGSVLQGGGVLMAVGVVAAMWVF
ncbi:early nodulin-like protein 14 [Vicia villosa]|uniref:early nodulin-like protein 14 n=1 Tax=Vicia villosa TaxID=3911 RepID=UPI00273B6BB9|nr:early nodulin-like protein 14 [Vicia villosa]